MNEKPKHQHDCHHRGGLLPPQGLGATGAGRLQADGSGDPFASLVRTLASHLRHGGDR